MKYAKNYLNTVSLADQLLQATAEGRVGKAAGGLAAREQRREARLSMDADFETVRASYINDIRNMFSDIGTEKERSQEIASYLEAPQTSPYPARNPEYWKEAPLAKEISADVTDENIRKILKTIKGKESGGDYTVKNPKGTASGGYQFIDSTWKSLTKKYGIGTEFASAKSAPPEIQDAVAAAYVKEILAQNNNDVTKVPLVWYTGNAQGQMSPEALAANNGYTAAEYQNNWLRRYSKIAGEEE